MRQNKVQSQIGQNALLLMISLASVACQVEGARMGTSSLGITSQDVKTTAPSEQSQSQPQAQSQSDSRILIDTTSIGSNQFILLQPIGTVLMSSSQLKLADGNYQITTRFGQGDFGSFQITNGKVRSATGALVASEQSISFDPKKLTTLSINPSRLSVPIQGLVNISVHELGVVAQSAITLHVPNGSYSVLTRNEGATFGSFDVLDGQVIGTHGALSQAGNSVGFDATRLASVSVDPAVLTVSTQTFAYVRIADSDSVFNSAVTLFLPDGDFDLETRSGNGKFGGFKVEHAKIVATSEALIYAGEQIRFDLYRLTSVAVKPVRIQNSAQYAAFSADLPDLSASFNSAATFYLPPGKYAVENVTDQHEYGSLTVYAGGSATTLRTQGQLVTEASSEVTLELE